MGLARLVLDLRRRLRLRRTPPGPLRDYLATPFPDPACDYRDAELLAVDLETTGLDPRRDQILSIGYVRIGTTRIDLSSARHHTIRIDHAIPEASAIIHQITDDQAARGENLGDAMKAFLTALAGRVMIAHHAHIERTFLNAACRRLYGRGLFTLVADTQLLARRGFERRNIPYKAADLRLHALGERYNLPRYDAHNALSDALAAAELFLAQAAYRDNGHGLPLKAFLC
ncbi:DNA polymerase III epsilon subunit-like 3'-5' exonuclease [Thioflavicoccus mobilis 8321]|uniref:DNA polymerase III epsilon subunit-like 3'-5' exonuclease n=1 Tax=Thioflavicoccus mobilis 8321 TaxID=765912 RepID=L0GXR5_9GAMM|nr:exonuclease domain-containing protein [Thioflavicoccus mobilis]AGA90089.1 DNA polymerase III epsilon subunit-like 3'-5' exonuclease [Thioflavicoccus mobilis 8321]